MPQRIEVGRLFLALMLGHRVDRTLHLMTPRKGVISAPFSTCRNRDFPVSPKRNALVIATFAIWKGRRFAYLLEPKSAETAFFGRLLLHDPVVHAQDAGSSSSAAWTLAYWAGGIA